MISDFMKYYIFDDLDKQIVHRIPYCLALSLIIYLLINMETSGSIYTHLTSLIPLDIYKVLSDVFVFFSRLSYFFWLGCLFFIFAISTSIFNGRINEKIEKMLINAEFNKFTEKMSMIFEGEDSLIDDIKFSENWFLIILGITSGFSFFLLLTSTFVILLNLFVGDKNLIIIAIVFVLIYLYQNIAKSDLINEFGDSENKSPFLFDVFQVYSVNNSLKSISINKFFSTSIIQPLMQILSIIIAPLTYLTIPKFSFDTSIVYKNATISDMIKAYTTNDNDQIYLKREDGLNLETFFSEQNCENVSVLNEKSLKENFPYLLDPKYRYTGNETKKWIAFRLLRKNQSENRTTGYIFIHLFKGIQIKRKTRQKRFREPYSMDVKPKQIFFFTFIGERSDVQYIKINIELNSAKFPLELINMEWDMS